MNSKILGLLAVGSMVGPISANAQSTTYTYQGDPLTAGSVNVTPPAGTTFVDVPPNIFVVPLTGFITLSAPLGDNLNDVSVMPTYVALNSGSPLFNGVFAFSTDGNGAIVGWSMSLNGDVGGPGGYTTTATSVDFGGKGGDTAAMLTTCTAYGGPSPESFICGSTGSNTTPGVWTSPASKVPEIDPAPAATGLTLLLGGVAMLLGRRKLGLIYEPRGHRRLK